jgi:predicted kinase
MENKNLIIINSTLGAGKSTTARHLSLKLKKSAVTHGDNISHLINDFSVYEEGKIEEALKLIAFEIDALLQSSEQSVVLDYVFENPKHFEILISALKTDVKIDSFYLDVDMQNIEQRIHNRGNEDLEWEIKRTREIKKIQLNHLSTKYFKNIINGNRNIDAVVSDILSTIKHS